MNYDTQMARGRFLKSSRETTVTLPLSSPFSSLFPGWRHDEPVVFRQIQSSKSTQVKQIHSSESIGLENRQP
jgi:hypothetical protein